jgi:hypothetical protein
MVRSVLLALALAAPLLAEEHRHQHAAAHGGVLNEIDGCAIGHAEILLEGPRLRLWFVDGGHATHRAIRVPETRLVLTAADGRTVTLTPDPLLLAGESEGDCSAFQGQAPWLVGLTQGRLTGQVTFKGRERTLVLTWPEGYSAALVPQR